jgi:hypothetical protein
MKSILITVITLIGLQFHAEASEGRFPRVPDLNETPGKICTDSTILRYPEKIPYCNRDVNVYMKQDVISKYDHDLGYSVGTMNRGDFKIDHLIPLCAGGANDELNLWPQHSSVYNITDPIEPVICQKMAEGKLSQKDAVAMVIFAKTHLDQVNSVLAKLNKL